MTDRDAAGHSSPTMETALPLTTPGAADFDAVYREHFPFVWRNLRRLGVAESHVEDAAQEVWVVVHRRLREFEGRSSMRTWLFGITMRTASDHRRWRRRKDPRDRSDEVDAVASTAPSPESVVGSCCARASSTRSAPSSKAPRRPRAIAAPAKAMGSTATSRPRASWRRAGAAR